MITSHPTGARYYPSRTAARQDRRQGERITRLGSFANGSFGCYAPLNRRDPNVGVTVWMVAPKA